MLVNSMEGVYIFENLTHHDERGYFREWSKKSFQLKLNLDINFCQFNLSKSNLGTLRGLHFAPIEANQFKIITCSSGKVLDTILDLRKSSKTFLDHFQIELSEDSGLSVLISPGLAHGFQSMSNGSVMVYGITDEYNPKSEQSINPLDKNLNITWPIPNPVISRKDLSAQNLDSYLNSFDL